MMTCMEGNTKAHVPISPYHAGQTCHPVVDATWIGPDKISIKLHWLDYSGNERQEYGHSEFTGTKTGAEKWLANEGVRLEGTGIR
jgi:hypothetical protein